MDKLTADFLSEFIEARRRIDDSEFEQITEKITQSVAFIRSFYDMLHKLNPSKLRRIWKNDYPIALEFELGDKLAVESMHSICNYLDLAVKNHLFPSGICNVIDKWSKYLLDYVYNWDKENELKRRPWFDNANKKFGIPAEIRYEFASAKSTDRMEDFREHGGSGLLLITGSELVRKGLNKISNPTPEIRNRSKKWIRGILGGTLFAIGAFEIVFDISTFEPFHSSISIAGGIHHVFHGGKNFWNAVTKPDSGEPMNQPRNQPTE